MDPFSYPEEVDLDELRRRQNQALIAPPSSAPAPVDLPGVVSPYQKDKAELDRLKSTGSGVDQFAHNHHILGPILKGLDLIGGIVAPGVSMAIPGTSMHHQALVNQASGRTEKDINDQSKQAQTAETNA